MKTTRNHTETYFSTINKVRTFIFTNEVDVSVTSSRGKKWGPKNARRKEQKTFFQKIKEFDNLFVEQLYQFLLLKKDFQGILNQSRKF